MFSMKLTTSAFVIDIFYSSIKMMYIVFIDRSV